MPLRTVTSLLCLGSAQWHYLRLQMPAQVVYLQAQNEEAMQLWISNIQRVSGVRTISQEYASWVNLRIESSADAAADGGEATWRRAWLVLLSNRQLMWFHSCYGPLYKGVIDLHKVAAIKPFVSDEEGHAARGCLEVRALGLRWLFSSDELALWQRQLLLSLEVCRRHAEATRLIKMNLSSKQPGAGWSSRRESLATEQGESNKRSSLRDLRSERATPRATDGSAVSSMKLHLMQGWLRLSWLPSSHAPGGRCYCTLRAGDGGKEGAVLEYSAGSISQKLSDTAVDMTDAVALYPASWADGRELQLVFADCVLCAQAERRGDAIALAAWHGKLAQQLERRAAAAQPETLLPAPTASVLHEGWVCWRSAAVSRTWQPCHCRLYEGALELVQLQRASPGGSLAPQLSTISLADAREVRRPEIGQQALCCGLALLQPGLTAPSSRFEIVRDDALEEVDALDAARAAPWVEALTAALRSQPGGDDPRQRLIRRCSSNV